MLVWEDTMIFSGSPKRARGILISLRVVVLLTVTESAGSSRPRSYNLYGFKEKAGDELGEYTQATGAAAQKMMDVALNITPEAKAWVKNWLTTKYNVNLGN